MFRHLDKLLSLNLTENPRLNSISNSALEPFERTLIRLSFDKCTLTNLDPTVINSLQNENLYIWGGSNPWNCDCKLEVCTVYNTYTIHLHSIYFAVIGYLAI